MTTAAKIRQLREEWGELQETRTGGLSREELEGFRGRFPDFCQDVLGFTLTPQQMGAAEAMEAGVPQLAIAGGNGLGKDTLTAARSIYEAFVLDALALLTGPSDRQVREVMMRREVGRLLRAARGKLRYERFTMAVHIPGKEPAGILAFTASDPDKFTGHHAPRIFVGVTEGQGTPEEIWQAAQKCKVGDGLFLAVGNPNQAAGPLYAASRSSTWETLHWSAFDHPNLIEGREVIPGGPTREWVDQMRAEYGEDSPFYLSAVLGQFPTEGSVDALVNLADIEAAFERHDRGVSLEGWPLPVVVLDVARSLGRDQNVAGIAKGPAVIRFKKWRSRDLVETATIFLEFADEARRDWHTVTGVRAIRADPPVRALDLIVDTPGVGGGVVDIIRDRDRKVQEYWGWNPAKDSRRFANLRAEVFWNLRDLLRDGSGALPRDPELQEDLLAMEWSQDAKGRIIMRSKDDLRKVLGRSPDTGDVAAMGLAASTGHLRWKAKGIHLPIARFFR